MVQQVNDNEKGTELIIGLVGAIGTEINKVVDILKERLGLAGYKVEEIKISTDIIPLVIDVKGGDTGNEYGRVKKYMDAGDKARKSSCDNSILACGVASAISSKRRKEQERTASKPYSSILVNSLKHPDEVVKLRQIYPNGFYLIGVHADRERRRNYLINTKNMKKEEALELIKRDENAHLDHGQRVLDTFHQADFFVLDDNNSDRLRADISRIVDILFGHPYITPTFDEYAMFFAFAASLRSADMSRQVGAVIAKENEIIATGANDCPRSGGGLYWPSYNDESGFGDDPKGRDYTRGEDANDAVKNNIINSIIDSGNIKGLDKKTLSKIINNSSIRDLTEFGRVVHAEMEALLSCARKNINSSGATLYSTTFPCHNCTKHIVAAGIKKVVFVEPYEKSRALEFHDDSISLGFNGKDEDKVKFEPFVGVGPRRFLVTSQRWLTL